MLFAPTFKKPKENQGLGLCGAPPAPLGPMDPLGAPQGSLGGPRGPQGQEIYTQTPDQPPETVATSIIFNIISDVDAVIGFHTSLLISFMAIVAVIVIRNRMCGPGVRGKGFCMQAPSGHMLNEVRHNLTVDIEMKHSQHDCCYAALQVRDRVLHVASPVSGRFLHVFVP